MVALLITNPQTRTIINCRKMVIFKTDSYHNRRTEIHSILCLQSTHQIFANYGNLLFIVHQDSFEHEVGTVTKQILFPIMKTSNKSHHLASKKLRRARAISSFPIYSDIRLVTVKYKCRLYSWAKECNDATSNTTHSVDINLFLPLCKLKRKYHLFGDIIKIF